jgi:3-hydroxybutyryl-CoA dehydratase
MSEFKMTEGESFKGPSKTLTDAHFTMFSAVTGDTHPIHYDVEYAKRTRFKKPIAHGLLLSSLVALGASDARERLDGLVMVEQGSTFLKPVVVGDTMAPRLTFEKNWTEGSHRFCRFTTELFNQNGDCVMRGFHVYRILQKTEERGE